MYEGGGQRVKQTMGFAALLLSGVLSISAGHAQL
jgi:hypothetical protein